jgi:hypothetical protein
MVQIVSPFFCYPKFDYAQIEGVYFSHRQYPFFCVAPVGVYCQIQRVAKYKGGGAQVDALKVQAQVNNADWRLDGSPVMKGVIADPPKFGGIPS